MASEIGARFDLLSHCEVVTLACQFQLHHALQAQTTGLVLKT
jgi:hypothetical protein